MFLIGLIEQNPAIKTFGDFTITAVTLASLVVGIYESVMRNIPESEQNNFEEIYLKAVDVLFKERHNYDVIHKNLNNE